MVRIAHPFRIGFLTLFVIVLAFVFNIAGLQDRYYGSKYFRPYAELKQEMRNGQAIQLKDGRIFLPNLKYSEIFNPKTKTSELVDGWDSINVYAATSYPKSLVLPDGNVMFYSGAPPGLGDNGVLPCEYNRCPKNSTPLFSVKTKRFQWMPFRLHNLQGATATLLPDGNIVFIGGLLDTGKGDVYGDIESNKPYINNDIILYNPKNDTFKILGHLNIHRYSHDALLINDHQILVASGKSAYSNKSKTLAADSNVIYDKGVPIRNYIYNVELVDLNAGKSHIVYTQKRKESPPFLLQLDGSKYILSWTGFAQGKIFSEVFDLSKTRFFQIISGPYPAYSEGLGRCIKMRNNNLICIARKRAREINTVLGQDKILDNLSTATLSNTVVFGAENDNLLVFGGAGNIMNQNKVVQIFNEDRYLNDNK